MESRHHYMVRNIHQYLPSHSNAQVAGDVEALASLSIGFCPKLLNDGHPNNAYWLYTHLTLNCLLLGSKVTPDSSLEKSFPIKG